jgi:hypothetical protein
MTGEGRGRIPLRRCGSEDRGLEAQGMGYVTSACDGYTGLSSRRGARVITAPRFERLNVEWKHGS